MAGPTFSDGGVIYEDLGNGQVRVVGYDSGPSATVAPNPVRAAREAQEAARKAAADERADRRENRMADTAEVSNELKRTELEIKRQQAEREGTTAKQLTEWRTNLNNIGLLEGQVKSLRKQYDDHFKGKGLLQSAAEEFAPKRFAPQYGVFDQTGQAMLADMAKAKGLTAQQFNTPAEQRMFFEPLIPKRGDTDEEILAKIEYLEKMIATGRATTEQNLGVDGQQAEDETDKAAAFVDSSPPGLPPANQGGNDPTPWDGPNADLQTAASGDMRFVDNPRARSTIASLINAGAGYATVAAAAEKAGARKPSMQEFNAVRAWMKQNPGKEYPASSIEAGEYLPLNLMQQVSGSPAGAFTAQMANAATAGTVGALAGERGRGALDAMAAMNPNASMAGNIVGGITGAMGAELGIGTRLAGTGLARFAPRIADSGFGAATGFNNAAEGEGLQGALTGAIVAPLAGSAGERAMRGVGAAVKGVTDPAVQRLRALGIPLTVGQAVGQSGPVGAAVNKLEQAMTSLPGVGSMVGARFDDGLEGFNRAAFEVGAETTGNQVQDVGSAGLTQLRKLVGDTYDNALNPNVRVDVTDPAVVQDIINAQMAASSIPQVGESAVNAIDYRVTGGTGLDGTMDGRDFQEAYRGLGRDGRSAARDAYGHEYQGAMGQAQDALAAGLEAQNLGAYQGFVNANTANRRAMVLADAVNAGRSQQDEMFTPAQLNAADANSATRLTGRLNSASGNRPFHDLAQDAQQVMGNRLPNSGTADRAWTGLALGAGLGGGAGYLGGDTGTGAGLGLGTTLALMLGGTRGGQQALTGAILNRPAIARAVGEAVKRNAQLGGGFGAGILTPLTVGPQ